MGDTIETIVIDTHAMRGYSSYINNEPEKQIMTILSTKYARRLIATGKAVREYKPLVRCTAERQLDSMYAVLRRMDAAGNVRFDHYVA